MPPRARLEDQVAALVAIERGEAPAATDALRAGLRHKAGYVVAAAARATAARGVDDLDDELVLAFGRLAAGGVERDPKCHGKLAIARALHDRDRWHDDVFVPGVRLVQLEPVWGGREDTAAELRGVCGLAFAHAYRGDALDVLADLLADRERVARVAAAQALGDAGHPDAAALLRFKLRVGDDEAEVLSACVGSILVLAPRTAQAFVESLLDGDDDRSCAAALGLAERRLASATPALIAWCERLKPATRGRAGYLALALVRADDANAYLLGRVTDGARADAIAAGKALATFRDDPALAEQLRAAAKAHPDRAVAIELGAALSG